MYFKLAVAFSAVLALATTEQRVSYDGYKAFSIATADDGQSIRDKLSDLEFVALSVHEVDNHFDVAIAPDSLLEFEALGLESTVISEDLGAEFAEESAFEDYYSGKSRLQASLSDLVLTIPCSKRVVTCQTPGICSACPFVVQFLPQLCGPSSLLQRSQCSFPVKLGNLCRWKVI